MWEICNTHYSPFVCVNAYATSVSHALKKINLVNNSFFSTDFSMMSLQARPGKSLSLQFWLHVTNKVNRAHLLEWKMTRTGFEPSITDFAHQCPTNWLPTELPSWFNQPTPVTSSQELHHYQSCFFSSSLCNPVSGKACNGLSNERKSLAFKGPV